MGVGSSIEFCLGVAVLIYFGFLCGLMWSMRKFNRGMVVCKLCLYVV